MSIRISNLKKEYSGKTVLDIESCTIEKGSITAVIGSNGAGKSTLINIIAGLETEVTGQVKYENGQISPKDITLVFQKPYLISTSVERNIGYPLKLRGWSNEAIEKRVTELTEEMGLAELRKQHGGSLSGGESQKVALARALAFNPSILLLDEPTANVDPATTGEIEQMLKKINQKEGTTIIIITHNLAQAKRLCSRLIFLNKGKLIESGDCQGILTNPKEELTKRFVAGELLI